ncbi:serine hydrolase domain-containing protein [Tahibacter caeni]|uniref:serine hydrolase domain-containing protein n=1 Tax=Tahibacter caeni TaxID=1453545 RepID=UPI0021487C27|nr:serine hydrolase domain-containing protein [Tahibacter caeni]
MQGLLSVLLLSLCLAAPAGAAVPAEFIDRYAAEHHFSGTVVVQQNGRIGYEKSFGYASIAFKVRNTPQTRYRIASITKAFTAVLVLQLAEQQRLDLQAPIRRYLPDYAGSGGDAITVQQLLNHTSGLPNFDQVKDLQTALSEGVPAYQKPATPAQLVSRHCSGAPVAAPGSTFDYNNCDYIVLGLILEKVAGKPYEALLQERLLQPLGLRHTGLLRQGRIVDGLADTYMQRDDLHGLADDLPVYPENWYAAGSLYSTAADVLAFSDALFGGKLLRAESLAAMTRPGLDDYGYGVWSYAMTIAGRPHRVVKRPGRIMGAQTQLFRLVDDDTTIVILANTDATDLDEFAAAIARQLFGGEAGAGRKAAGTAGR